MKLTARQTIVILSLSLITPLGLQAHCDTLDGPVVQSARDAIAKGEVTPVLKWIKADHEPEIRAAFAETLAVRPLSSAAAQLADRSFFETLVRIHREGEGAPYTGLKSGEPVEPGIQAADQALASGHIDELTTELEHRIGARVRAKAEQVRALQAHADHNVEAGRAYVAAYVDFIHFVERLSSLASSSSSAPAHIH